MENNDEVFDLDKAFKQVLKNGRHNIKRRHKKVNTMTLTHTDYQGIVVKTEGKDISEAMGRLLKEKGITIAESFTDEDVKKLKPPIAEATWI